MASRGISGQITDASGNPIGSAEVYLWREDLAGSYGTVATTSADSDGKFSFPVHPNGGPETHSWHVAAKDPNASVQLQSAYGISAFVFPSTTLKTAGVRTDGPVNPGETLTVYAQLFNDGPDMRTHTITLSVDNGVGQVDSTIVALEGDEATVCELEWSVPSDQTKQQYGLTVSTENDNTSTVDVKVADTASFGTALQTDSANNLENSPVAAGGTLDVNTQIFNNGNATGEHAVTLNVDNKEILAGRLGVDGLEQVDFIRPTIESGASVQKTLSWDVPRDITPQTYSVLAKPATYLSSGDVLVEEPYITEFGNYVTNWAGDYTDADGTYYRELSTDGEIDLVGQDKTSNPVEYRAITSTAGLPNYPSQGDTWQFKFSMWDASGGQYAMLFGVQSETGWANAEGYAIWADAGNSSLQIHKLTGGASTQLASTNFTFSSNTTYTVIVSWGTDGSISVDDMLEGGSSTSTTVSATDSTYNDGGIGWLHKLASNKEEVQFQSAKIRP